MRRLILIGCVVSLLCLPMPMTQAAPEPAKEEPAAAKPDQPLSRRERREAERAKAEKEQAEIPVIEAYLPASASDDEIQAVVDDVVKSSGVTSIKDMGSIMKQCMARFAGKLVDGKKVNAAVKARLENPSGK